MIKILYDTREQNPLTWKNELKPYEVTLARETFECGDYTIVGHDMPGDDNSVIIERKKNSLELVGNLGTNWDRFCNELELMSKYKYKQIVVCGPDNFSFLYSRGYTKLSPSFVYKQLVHIFIYFNISTIFLNSREEAENYLYRMFVHLSNKTEAENVVY